MSTEYAARILKLRLPEQDALKNTSERCSADPGMLESIGRSIGQQVRIKRKDDPRFFALYTVKQANPKADLNDRPTLSIVRTGQAGRKRLSTTAGIEATVQATVLDVVPTSGEPDGAKFFEISDDDGTQAYLVSIAPHGGDIEKHTDDQAAEVGQQLRIAGFPASVWLCKGFGDAAKGALDRWHITSTDIQPPCFPLLQPLVARRFCYAVAFHGFRRQKGEADVYIGGGASRPVKVTIRKALNDLDLPIKVKISTAHDSPKFQGFSADNITNRIATSGIHLEQSAQARKYHLEIARAVAQVFASYSRFLVCILVQAIETERATKKVKFVQELSKSLAYAPLKVEHAIEDFKTWKATDDVLAAMVKTTEELNSLCELASLRPQRRSRALGRAHRMPDRSDYVP